MTADVGLAWNCDFCHKPGLVISQARIVYCNLCSMTYGEQLPNIYSKEDAMKLGEQFAKELEKEIGTELIFWFIGSIQKDKYVAGMSDIDMIIIPKNAGMFNYDGVKAMMNKVEEYKKYGTVFKKGR